MIFAEVNISEWGITHDNNQNSIDIKSIAEFIPWY